MQSAVVEKKSFTARLQLIFKGLKSEWMKIVFPSKETVLHDSVLVVVASFIIGLIIFVFDIIISNGLGLILK